ncbi:hypothetical protein [Pseudomonas fulva]|uniref:hypothetical protein n=1 Tax=Pseudomonas fulva TaxID=47880 RepID=UPI003F91D4FF
MKSFHIDRMELLEAISSIVSSKAFDGISLDTDVHQYRERCDEYGQIMGRITAVVLAGTVDSELLFSIKELTLKTQQSAWNGLRETIKPGGEMSQIISDYVTKLSP